jgi:uncharacterized protein YecT (DUF1311 family)
MKNTTLIAILLFSTSTFAQENTAIHCNPDGNQVELDACSADDFAAAQRELNDVYGSILVQYKDDPLFLKKLKIAQALWVKLRDAEVEARFPVTDGENPGIVWGSSYPMIVTYYRAELTRQRIQHLRIWLDGAEEGDLSAGSVRMKEPTRK